MFKASINKEADFTFIDINFKCRGQAKKFPETNILI